jgi:hypothetical protein
MSPDQAQQILDTLREIRDAQRELISMAAAQYLRAEEQVQKSRESVAESVGLQRLALERQRSVTRIAIPAILACIAAIGYLVWRYF